MMSAEGHDLCSNQTGLEATDGPATSSKSCCHTLNRCSPVTEPTVTGLTASRLGSLVVTAGDGPNAHVCAATSARTQSIAAAARRTSAPEAMGKRRSINCSEAQATAETTAGTAPPDEAVAVSISSEACFFADAARLRSLPTLLLLGVTSAAEADARARSCAAVSWSALKRTRRQ